MKILEKMLFLFCFCCCSLYTARGLRSYSARSAAHAWLFLAGRQQGCWKKEPNKFNWRCWTWNASMPFQWRRERSSFRGGKMSWSSPGPIKKSRAIDALSDIFARSLVSWTHTRHQTKWFNIIDCMTRTTLAYQMRVSISEALGEKSRRVSDNAKCKHAHS